MSATSPAMTTTPMTTLPVTADPMTVSQPNPGPHDSSFWASYGVPSKNHSAIPTVLDDPMNSQRPAASITLQILEFLIEEYLSDCELSLLSPRTVETRRVFFRNFLWFLNHRHYAACGETELRQFFYYLIHGHEEAGGRFGHPRLNRAARPVTVKDYYNCLRPFFDWVVAHGRMSENPFDGIPKPQAREEIKTALSARQIEALLDATDVSPTPLRNRAILTFLLDTGCRASELISIRRNDIDLINGRCQVLGKGNKYRTLFFGQKTAEALLRYLAHEGVQRDDTLSERIQDDNSQNDREFAARDKENLPLFPSARGDGPLTRSGLLRLVKRLGKTAGIRDAACVHALRRSFAVQMLRNGANVFSVQEMLGHTNLQQTRKYCALALADSEAQHRQFSPMDRMACA